MKLILLHPDDNVLVLGASVTRGERLAIDGAPVVAPMDLPAGHKLARVRLEAGDKVFKYGASIGSMVTSAERGDHVHIHNMKSDYIPSHTRGATGGET